MTKSLTALRRASNRVRALALTISGLALIGVAAAGLAEYRSTAEALSTELRSQTAAAPAASGGTTAAECTAFLRQSGAQKVVHAGPTLKASLALSAESLAEVETAIYRLSLAASQCAYRVTSFCAGPACELPGLHLELQAPQSTSK